MWVTFLINLTVGKTTELSEYEMQMNFYHQLIQVQISLIVRYTQVER